MQSRNQVSASGSTVPLGGASDTVTNIAFSATNGAINALGTLTAGSSYTNGTYSNVPLTGGSGIGATANITVASNHVTAVTIVNPGNGYAASDSLSAAASSIGGTGSGFSQVVSTIHANTNAVAIPIGAATVNITVTAPTFISFTTTLAVEPATTTTSLVIMPSGTSRQFLVSGLPYISLACGSGGNASLEFYKD